MESIEAYQHIIDLPDHMRVRPNVFRSKLDYVMLITWSSFEALRKVHTWNLGDSRRVVTFRLPRANQ